MNDTAYQTIRNEFNTETFTEFLIQLAKTPGPTFGEAPRRIVLEALFDNHGIVSQTDSVGNLIVLLKEGEDKDLVVFDAHMDVVQKGVADHIEQNNGFLKGPGICDNLTAVAMLAFMAISLHKHRDQMKKPCCFLFSVCEEGSGNLAGVNQFIKDRPVPPWLFIAFDLSFDEYSIAALGSIRYRINFKCPGGHSFANAGEPSAIDQIILFYNNIKAIHEHLQTTSTDIITFNAGEITGGEGINSIARNAELTFEFRSDSPTVLNAVEEKVEAIIRNAGKRAGAVLTSEKTGKRPAADPVKPHRIEPVIKELLLSETETKPCHKTRSTSINATLAQGWPSICLGLCRGGNYHRKDEFVELKSFEQGWNLFTKLVDNLLLTPQ